MAPRFYWVLVLVGIVVMPASAFADGDASNALSVDVESGLTWQDEWRPVGWVDVGLTVGLCVGTLSLDDYFEPNGRSNWVGGALFDSDVRGRLAATSASGRQAAATVSDVGIYGLMAWPMLDAALVMAVHGEVETSAQMAGITMQTFAVTSFMTELTKRIVRRKRPDASSCMANGDCSEQDSVASFWSGHTTMAFTAAGLTCAHHGELPIYGGGAGDVAACAGATGLAALTGMMRVVADRHHTTDVLTGAAFGLSMGYFLPQVLHYASPFDASNGNALLLTPFTEDDALGMSLIGVF